jgi:ATP-dependent Clp protease ATP-binding subunit ClpB
VIQRDILNPLSLKLLQGEFREGDVIRVDVHEGRLVFEKAGVAQPAS